LLVSDKGLRQKARTAGDTPGERRKGGKGGGGPRCDFLEGSKVVKSEDEKRRLVTPGGEIQMRNRHCGPKSAAGNEPPCQRRKKAEKGRRRLRSRSSELLREERGWRKNSKISFRRLRTQKKVGVSKSEWKKGRIAEEEQIDVLKA